MLLPLRFPLALLVGIALPLGDFIERAPLRFHPHVGVAREHGARDVAGDAHNRFFACPGLGEC